MVAAVRTTAERIQNVNITSDMPKKSKRKQDTSKSNTSRRAKSNHKEMVAREEKLCTFFTYLTFAKSVITVKNIPKSMLIRDFKEHLVLACGVPLFIQRLAYLDSCEMRDDRDLRSLDVVNNASFRLSVWGDYEKLMRSVYHNDFEGLLTCRIQRATTNRENASETLNSDKTTHDDIGKGDRLCSDISGGNNIMNVAEVKLCGETALFSAASLGQLDMVKKLVEMGVDLNCRTKLGYSPLHASMASGEYQTIDFLLEAGAQCDKKSKQTKKAFSIAKLNGFEESERHLRSFEWQKRAKTSKVSPDPPLLMHQQFDSKCPTWLKGRYGIKYMCSTLPAGEFSGTKLDSPLSKSLPAEEFPGVRLGSPLTKSSNPDSRKENSFLPDIAASNVVENERLASRQRLGFDKWIESKRQQKAMAIQRSAERESMQTKVKEEKEKKMKTMKLHFMEDQKRIKSRIQDELSEKCKMTMYTDHQYPPRYQDSLIRQYMDELFLKQE